MNVIKITATAKFQICGAPQNGHEFRLKRRIFISFFFLCMDFKTYLKIVQLLTGRSSRDCVDGMRLINKKKHVVCTHVVFLGRSVLGIHTDNVVLTLKH